MRVLLDSNVLARASYSLSGPAAALLDRLSRPPHVLVISSFILAELDRILRYPRLRRVHGFSDDQIVRFVTETQFIGVLADPQESAILAVVPGDPNDDPIVATAIKGRADVICTLDSDLQEPEVLRYCNERGIRIMSDVDILRELRRADASNA